MPSVPSPVRLMICCAALAGCSGSTDPATAHLFDNIANLNSGEYDRQIVRKDAEAAAIIRSNQQMEGNISSMRSEAAGNRQTIASLRQQIAAAQREAAAARVKVGEDPVRLGKVRGYESQLAAIQNDASGGSDPAVLQSEVARIRASIRALSN
ncbi:hypothetical protein LAZ29_12695 [Cereibacter sphaeroides]|uniref:hypothetical protein n=1 Tax=Cereibacter sphaeroides TaxID=1063 RepID=UPI001F3F0445|nr:hypothetical protein [Cereibacter sphaeroides]MCE6951787.1 hypothetical protein [Cereibacter sphaeroides]